jgi:hypothetical protein
MAADCVATPCVRPRPSGRGLTAFFWGSPGSLELSPNPDFLSTQRHAVFFPWILTVCGAVQHPLLPQRRRVFPWILAVCGAVNFFRPRILEVFGAVNFFRPGILVVFGAGTFLIPPLQSASGLWSFRVHRIESPPSRRSSGRSSMDALGLPHCSASQQSRR